jgi:hypothetical protein
MQRLTLTAGSPSRQHITAARPQGFTRIGNGYRILTIGL